MCRKIKKVENRCLVSCSHGKEILPSSDKKYHLEAYLLNLDSSWGGLSDTESLIHSFPVPMLCNFPLSVYNLYKPWHRTCFYITVLEDFFFRTLKYYLYYRKLSGHFSSLFSCLRRASKPEGLPWLFLLFHMPLEKDVSPWLEFLWLTDNHT